MGETYSIQGTFDDVIYNLWGMNYPNYAMRMMDNGGRILVGRYMRGDYDKMEGKRRRHGEEVRVRATVSIGVLRYPPCG